MEGNPRFEGSQRLRDIPHHRFAEVLGLRGIFVDKPERLGDAWDAAFSAAGPVLLEVKADPNVPPLPPHVTLKQARQFLTSLYRPPGAR